MTDDLKSRISDHLKRAIREIWQPWNVLDEEASDSNDKNCDAFHSVSVCCAPDAVFSSINQACDDIELEITGKIDGWLRESTAITAARMSEITRKLKLDCDQYCRYWEPKCGFRGFLGTIFHLVENPLEVPKAWFGTSSIQKKVDELTDPIINSMTLIGDQIVALTIEIERAITMKTGKSFKFNSDR